MCWSGWRLEDGSVRNPAGGVGGQQGGGDEGWEDPVPPTTRVPQPPLQVQLSLAGEPQVPLLLFVQYLLGFEMLYVSTAITFFSYSSATFCFILYTHKIIFS